MQSLQAQRANYICVQVSKVLVPGQGLEERHRAAESKGSRCRLGTSCPQSRGGAAPSHSYPRLRLLLGNRVSPAVSCLLVCTALAHLRGLTLQLTLRAPEAKKRSAESLMGSPTILSLSWVPSLVALEWGQQGLVGGAHRLVLWVCSRSPPLFGEITAEQKVFLPDLRLYYDLRTTQIPTGLAGTQITGRRDGTWGTNATGLGTVSSSFF